MEYWKALISMAQRVLSDKGEVEAVSVIKNGQIDIRLNAHDNWNGGIDYWDIAFQLKYKDYIALNDRSAVEKLLDETISMFHNDDSNPIANVIVEPVIERLIDWKSALPETKESTIKLIIEEQNVLMDHATGKSSFKSDGAEEDYQTRHKKIIDIAKRAGFDYPVKADSLVEWWAEVRGMSSYAERREYISKMISPLIKLLRDSDDDTGNVNFSLIATRSEIVNKAIEDAEVFIRDAKYDSAVDRVHTAFHGYLQQLLTEHHIIYTRDDSLPALYSKLHEFYGIGIQPADVAARVKSIVRSGSGMVNAVNELRNNNTIAHPNGTLIQKREAQLVIRLVNAIVDYIENVEQSVAS